jgi:uncharacterized protein
VIKPSKSVSDPVHGTIELSELEARVISTRAFQRLRNVKQLGLAHMVFPGADYSRFSHCLGVCHVTKRTLHILRSLGEDITDAEEQRYRLAALLHDVGHYPFSHAMETAVQGYATAKLTDGGAGKTANDVGSHELWLHHETLGKEVLRNDPELKEVITKAGYEPADIYQIFAREIPKDRFMNLISSDLDADRIDFLMRTAHHTGLPYGDVDLDYLLSQIRMDAKKQICIHPKALRTADHFLLGRYFDYQQVAFHKTVAGLEWVLIEVIKRLLSEGVLDMTPAAVRLQIANGEWATFNDSFLIECIRKLAQETKDGDTRVLCEAVLFRRPPKLLVQRDFLGGRSKAEAAEFRSHRTLLGAQLPGWQSAFGIAKGLWHVWEGGFKFTKVGKNVAVSELLGHDDDQTNQAILVLNRHNNSSTPIMSVRRSLMSVLADRALYSLRLYVVLPSERESELPEMRDKIRSMLEDPEWA